MWSAASLPPSRTYGATSSEADRSEPLVGLPNGRYAKPAPRNDLDTLCCIRPKKSPSRGSGMWHCIEREHGIEPRLGKRIDVTAPSEPVQHITSGKRFSRSGASSHPGPRPVGLATCRAVGLAKAEARQRSTKASPTFHLSPLTAPPLLATGFQPLTPLFLQLSRATRCTADETKFSKE